MPHSVSVPASSDLREDRALSSYHIFISLWYIHVAVGYTSYLSAFQDS